LGVESRVAALFLFPAALGFFFFFLFPSVGLDNSDALITDQGLPADAQVLLGEHVGRLVVATGRSGQRRSSASSDGP
jgi:hypothetical protein